MYQTVCPAHPGAEHETARLRDEIEQLQQRLRCMGEDGDCAYERAMSKLYRDIVEAKMRRLCELAVAVNS